MGLIPILHLVVEALGAVGALLAVVNAFNKPLAKVAPKTAATLRGLGPHIGTARAELAALEQAATVVAKAG